VDEIVVTATLRGDTALRAVPASVAVLDAATIERSAVQHFEELAPLVPNLNWSGEGARARYFQVRGIGELEQYEGAPNAAVGFVVDDIDFSALGGVATTFDAERVEVLRGPQGTRYGANALAGLVYVQSAAPPDAPEARAEALAGSDGAAGVGFAAGAPLAGDALAGRIAVQRYSSDGFRANAFLGRDDTTARDELTARGRLRWRPADGWQADLTGLLVDLDDGYDHWALDNGFTTRSDRPGEDDQRTGAGALRVTGALGEVATLTSITGAASSDILFSFDADWGNPPGWAPDAYAFTQRTDRERRTVNQELRLASGPAARLPGGGEWLVGLYALDLAEDNRVTDAGLLDLDDAACDGGDPSFCAPFAVDRSADSAYDATSLAAYGELAWPLGAATRVRLGLRGERREADYAETAVDRVAATTTRSAFSPTDRMWGGELALTRDFGPRASAFGRVARGYRAGGFNPGLARLAPNEDQVSYGDESLLAWELGWRLAPGGAAWSAYAQAFWQEREDMQVKVPTQYRPGDPNTFVFLTDNAESGHAGGIEAGAAWSPAPAWRLELDAAWLRTGVDEFSADPFYEGFEFPHAPRVSARFSTTYEHPGGWFARVDVAGRGAFRFDYDTSTGEDRKAGAATLVNLRAGLRRAGWEATLWLRNAFDEDYATRGFWFGNEPPGFAPTRYVRLGDPREAGVTVAWRLGAD
jgi:outer membrane receptor protein involved in Fe transport